ncbi:MAG: type II toxin-antitoxin system RelE/ParE family toxin [Bradyrhizobium sp.]
MKVRYSRRANKQIQEIGDYIGRHNAGAAARVTARIAALTRLLGQHPRMGRATDKEGVRVVSVLPFPYVIFYKISVEADEIEVLRVRHTARK